MELYKNKLMVILISLDNNGTFKLFIFIKSLKIQTNLLNFFYYIY